MKHIYSIFKTISAITVAVFSLANCTNDIDIAKTTGKLVISAQTGEPELKSSIKETEFNWLESDKIGVFVDQPNLPVNNVPCSILTISGDGKNAEFTSDNEVSLDMTGKRYICAYYPYKSSQTSSELLITVPQYQKQTGIEASHVGKYDYMVTRRTELAGESVSMKFNHLMTKVDILFVNEHDTPLTVTSVNLKTEGNNKFYTAATYKLLETNPILSKTESGATETIGVETSGKWTVVEPDDNITASIMMIPVDLSDQTVQVRVTTKEKGDFVFEKDGIDFLAQNRYRVILSLKERTFLIEPSELDFGTTATEKQFKVTALNDTQAFNISSDADWLSFSTTSFTLQADGEQIITATVDRDKLTPGKIQTTKIAVSTGEVTKYVSVSASSPNGIETYCTDESFVVTVDSCKVFNKVATVWFGVKNVTDVSKNITIYDSRYGSSGNNYAYAYDDLGSQYRVSSVNGESYYCSKNIPAGESVKISLTIDDVDRNASRISFIKLRIERNSYYYELYFKDIPIAERTAMPRPEALKGFSPQTGEEDLQYEVYEVQHRHPDVIFRYRVKNNSDEIVQLRLSYPICFDAAGNEYLIKDYNLGFVSNSNYTHIPPKEYCNGEFTVTGLPTSVPRLDYLSFRTCKSYFYNYNSSSQEYYNEMVMKNSVVGDEEIIPPLADVSVKAPSYIYHADNDLEFTFVSSKVMDNQQLSVKFRVLNKSKYIKYLSFSESNGYCYAYDDRDNYYEIGHVYFGSNGSDAYLAPGMYCNGRFTISGISNKASSLKYFTSKTEYGDNYASTKSCFFIAKDIEIEGRSVCEDPMPEAQTTAESVTSFDQSLVFTPISCTVENDNVAVFKYKIKNVSTAPRWIQIYPSNSKVIDDAGMFNSGSAGSYEWVIPDGQESYVDIQFDNISKDAGIFKYIGIYVATHDRNYSNSKSGTIEFRNVKIQGRTAYPEVVPSTTAASASCSIPGIAVNVISCAVKDNSARVRLQIVNNNTSSESISFYTTSSSSSNSTMAFDDRGNVMSISDIFVGGKSSASIAPNCSVFMDFVINDVAAETALFQYINLYYSSTRAITLKDLKIEGREETTYQWPNASSAFGSVESNVSNISFTGVESKILSDGSLRVKYIITNQSLQQKEITFNSNSRCSYVFDDMGNSYQLGRTAIGNCDGGSWGLNSPGYGTYILAPASKVYGYFIVPGFDSKASQLKEISLCLSSSDCLTRLLMKNVAVEGRTAGTFPEATTTCGEITSCSDDLEFSILGCKVSDGQVNITMKVLNTSYNVKRIYKSSYPVLTDTNSKTYTMNNPYLKGNPSQDYLFFLPGIPAVITFSDTNVFTESDTFSSMSAEFNVYTGFELNNSVKKTLLVKDIKIEGR